MSRTSDRVCMLELNTDMTRIVCSKCGWEVPAGTNPNTVRECGGCERVVVYGDIPRLYLIGPVTGKPNDNRETFRAVRAILRKDGYECDCPHHYIEQGTSTTRLRTARGPTSSPCAPPATCARTRSTTPRPASAGGRSTGDTWRNMPMLPIGLLESFLLPRSRRDPPLPEPPSLGRLPYVLRHIQENHRQDRRTAMPLSQMKCCKCGGMMPVRRRRGHLRKRNHIKTMWCPWCKRVTQHRERF